MPPLIVWTFGAIGAAVMAKWVVRKARQINAVLRPGGSSESDPDPPPTLRRDPVTGIYSPK